MPNTNTWEQPCCKVDVLNNVMTEVEHKIAGREKKRENEYTNVIKCTPAMLKGSYNKKLRRSDIVMLN